MNKKLLALAILGMMTSVTYAQQQNNSVYNQDSVSRNLSTEGVRTFTVGPTSPTGSFGPGPAPSNTQNNGNQNNGSWSGTAGVLESNGNTGSFGPGGNTGGFVVGPTGGNTGSFGPGGNDLGTIGAHLGGQVGSSYGQTAIGAAIGYSAGNAFGGALGSFGPSGNSGFVVGPTGGNTGSFGPSGNSGFVVGPTGGNSDFVIGPASFGPGSSQPNLPPGYSDSLASAAYNSGNAFNSGLNRPTVVNSTPGSSQTQTTVYPAFQPAVLETPWIINPGSSTTSWVNPGSNGSSSGIFGPSPFVVGPTSTPPTASFGPSGSSGVFGPSPFVVGPTSTPPTASFGPSGSRGVFGPSPFVVGPN